MRQKAGKTVWVSSSGLSVNGMQKYKFKRAAVYIENEDSITPSPESISFYTTDSVTHVHIRQGLQHFWEINMNNPSKHMLRIQTEQYSWKKYLVCSKPTKLSLKLPSKM